MSLSTAENLLRQYKKFEENKSHNTSAIKEEESDKNLPFGRFVYANPIDAAYEKYSTDKNFNINMWQQALATGEEDKYITLLEKNKGRELSADYYDPQYYDYETMMLELYQPFAPQDDTEPRYKDVYDPGTDEWKQESIGDMNSRQYIEYQLAQIRAGRSAEITKQLEQWHKDQMTWAQKTWHSTLATGAELGEGILSAVTGLVDFVASPVAAGIINKNVEGNYLDAFVEYFGGRGLTAFEKQTVRAALDEYERTHTHFKDIDGNITGWGTYVAGIANSIGMMVPSILLAIPTGGTSLAWMGQATFYASLFSQNMYENATNPYTVGSPSWMKITNAALTTGAELVIEKALGKFLGGTIQNQMLGMNGGLKAFKSSVSTKAAWGYIGKSAAQEGLEEFLQDFGTECINQFTSIMWKGYGETGVTFQTLVDSFFAGALTSVLLAGTSIGKNTMTRGWRNRFAKDPETGKRIYGAGDTIIETDKDGKKEITKLTGVKELYFKSMLSNFQQAVKDLGKKKLSDNKSIKLAQEVYGTFSVLAQYYSSLSPERIKNAELLLGRVLDKDYVIQDGPLAGTKLSTTDKARNYGTWIKSEFSKAFSNLRVRHSAEIEKSLTRVEKKLEESGAKKILSATDSNGETQFSSEAESDPKIKKEVDELKKDENTSHLLRLAKRYKWVFTTDGDIAVPDGDILYCPSAWIKNFDTNTIEEFLAQNDIITTIIQQKKLQPLISDLIEFDKKFTGQTDVTADRAMTDLLFNSSVYKAFLLSDNGKYVNKPEYRKYLFDLHSLLSNIGSNVIETSDRLSKESKELRKAYLAKLVKQIKKDVLRKPMILAILNWNIRDYDQIGQATNIFTPEDKHLFKQYFRHRDALRDLLKDTPISSEYKNLAEDILMNPIVSQKARNAILAGLKADATIDQKVEAVALLDYFDKNTNALIPEFVQQSVTVPYYAEDLSIEDRSIVIDAFKEFERFYHVSPEELLTIGLDGLTNESRFEVERDMNFYGYGKEDVFLFVQRKMEEMLGNKYIVVPTSVTDDSAFLSYFQVCKKIPAEKFLSKDILSLDVDRQNQIFMSLMYEKSVEKIISDVRSLFDKYEPYLFWTVDGVNEEAAEDYYLELKQLIMVSPDKVREYITDGVDPITNETFYDEAKVPIDLPRFGFYRDLGRLIDRTDTTMTISDVLDLSILPETVRIEVGMTKIVLKELPENVQGSFVADTISISTMVDNAFETIIHEFNHVLQDIFELPGGFNKNNVRAMPDLVLYACEHYPTYIESVCGIDNIQERLASYTNLKEALYAGKNLEKMIRAPQLYWAVYRLIYGEMLARDYMHNERRYGFYRVQDRSGHYIVSPDGKRRFSEDAVQSDGNSIASLEEIDVSPQVTQTLKDALVYNELEKTFFSVIDTAIFNRHKDEHTRNTYHAILSNRASADIISALISSNVSTIDQIGLTIDEIVRDPKYYCNDEILKELNGNYSIGNAQRVIRSYIERTFKDVSLDRTTDGRYILVDDNSFDDAYNTTMKPSLRSTNDNIVKRYENLDVKESPTLSTFYKKSVLNDLGIDGDIKVIVGPLHSTQTLTVGNEIIVYINSSNLTNEKFFNKLNHEFRHVLQTVYNFSPGFTPNFVVSDKIISDLKKHVGGIFTNPVLNKWLEYNGYKTIKDREIYIVQHFIYLLNSGELNANMFESDVILDESILIKYTPTGAKALMPWYDANTGDGLYDLKRQGALRSEDIPEEYQNIDIASLPPAKPKLSHAEIYEKLVNKRLNDLVDDYEKNYKGSEKAKKNMRNYLLSDDLRAVYTKLRKMKQNIEEKIKQDVESKDTEATKRDNAKLLEIKKQLAIADRIEEARIKIQAQVQEYAAELKKRSPQELYALYQKKDKASKSVSKTDIPEEYQNIDIASLPSVKSTKKRQSLLRKDAQLDKDVMMFGAETYISKDMAKDNNLKYYVGKDLRDPALKAFIKATTGHEDELPPEIVKALKDRTLTRKRIQQWFRKVEPKNINAFTFKLVNDHFFHNTVIQDVETLERMLKNDPAFIYSAVMVLMENGYTREELLRKGTRIITKKTKDGFEREKKYGIDLIEKFRDNPQFGNIAKAIRDRQIEFWSDDASIQHDAKVRDWMKVAFMLMYDGSTASLLKITDKYKETLEYAKKGYAFSDSLDATIDGKDDSKMSKYDAITESDVDRESMGPGNDLIALYEASFAEELAEEMSVDVMIKTLVKAKREIALNKYFDSREESQRKEIESYFLKPDTLKAEIKRLKQLDAKDLLTEKEREKLNWLSGINEDYLVIRGRIEDYLKKLNRMSEAEVAARYQDYRLAETLDTPMDLRIVDEGVNSGKKLSLERKDVARRIKDTSRALIYFLGDNDISWDVVPDDIKAFFVPWEQLGEENIKSKKFYKITDNSGKSYGLKAEMYSVGRGKKKIEKKGGPGKGLYYAPIQNLDEEYDLTKDRTKIILNDQKLRDYYNELKNAVKKEARLDKLAQEKLEKIEQRVRKEELKKNTKAEEYRVEVGEKKSNRKKTKEDNAAVHSNQIAHNVVITSTTPIPDKLKSLLDVSFSEMADTLVQFATRDKNTGELYDKKKNTKEFESAVQHEVASMEKFYTLVAPILDGMSRNEALDIIKFIPTMTFNLDSLSSTLPSLLEFTLAYIVSAARFNHNAWNFSEAEIEEGVKLHQKMGHAGGRILNSIKQVQDVINPYRVVSENALDDFGIPKSETRSLFDAIVALDMSKDAKSQKENAEVVLARIKDLEEKMIIQGKKVGKQSLWERIKSFRYMGLLSNPATWARNVVSNVMLFGMNKASDKLANAIFYNKGYKESQWDLANVKPDAKVKKFIDEAIMSNDELFSPFYEMQNKYTTEIFAGKDNDLSGAFYRMVVQSLRTQYYMTHRFNTKAMNTLQGWVNKAISDKAFVKKAANDYFAKILTLEQQAGRIDISNGHLTKEILNLFANSIALASEEYMHKTSALVDILETVKDKQPGLYEILIFWQPFMNSGFNWFVELLKYSPLGLGNAIIRLCKFEKNIGKIREKDGSYMNTRATQYLLRRDIGKGIIGLILAVCGAFLLAAGKIRMEDDDDKFYVYLNEKLKVDVTDWFGSSSLLAGAAIAQAWTKEGISFEQVMSNFTDVTTKGFLISDLIERHTYDENFYDWSVTELENAMKSFVPQAWQLLIRCTNEQKISYTPGIMGGLERWINSFVPTQPAGNRIINIYTGEVQEKGGIPVVTELFAKSGVAFGLKFYSNDIGPVEDFALTHNVSRKQLSGVITINGKEYYLDKDTVNIKYGKLNSETLLTLQKEKHYVQMEDGSYKTLSWNKLTDKQKERVIERTMTRNADIAKIYYWTEELGRKYYASDSLWTELRKYGITKNVYKGDKGFVE